MKNTNYQTLKSDPTNKFHTTVKDAGDNSQTLFKDIKNAIIMLDKSITYELCKNAPF